MDSYQKNNYHFVTSFDDSQFTILAFEKELPKKFKGILRIKEGTVYGLGPEQFNRILRTALDIEVEPKLQKLTFLEIDESNTPDLKLTVTYDDPFNSKEFILDLSQDKDISVEEYRRYYKPTQPNNNSNRALPDTNVAFSAMEEKIKNLEQRLINLEGKIKYAPGFADKIKHLEEKVTKLSLPLIESQSRTVRAISLSQGTLSGSGQYWNWKHCNFISNGYFSRPSNDVVTIEKDGIYHVSIFTTCGANSHNYYMSLYIDGKETKRVYSPNRDAYYSNYVLVDMFQLKKGNKLQVYQSYYDNLLHDNVLYNSFCIHFLGFLE